MGWGGGGGWGRDLLDKPRLKASETSAQYHIAFSGEKRVRRTPKNVCVGG